MKKLMLSAILFLGLTVTGFAQEKQQRAHKTPEERAQMITDHMAQKLSLSDNQKSQIYQINLERAQAMGKFKGDKEKADRSQMKAQFEASENRILAVLNDNQKATYAQLKAERQTKFKEHKGSHKRDSKK